jgi:hypothetical protein
MNVIASGGAHWIAIAVIAVVAWLLGHSRSGDEPADPNDPNAPDEQGFTPADKYGYGYDYSWGDPFGDPEL